VKGKILKRSTKEETDSKTTACVFKFLEPWQSVIGKVNIQASGPVLSFGYCVKKWFFRYIYKHFRAELLYW